MYNKKVTVQNGMCQVEAAVEEAVVEEPIELHTK